MENNTTLQKSDKNKEPLDKLALWAFVTSLFYTPPIYLLNPLFMSGLFFLMDTQFSIKTPLEKLLEYGVKILFMWPMLPTILTLVALYKIIFLKKRERGWWLVIPAGLIIVIDIVAPTLINLFTR